MSSFEERCLEDGFDSTGTLFFISYNDRINRWNNGCLVPTDFFMEDWEDWGDFLVGHNIYGELTKFSGVAFVENSHIFMHIRNGGYHRDIRPSALGVAMEGRPPFMRWHQNDTLHNSFGPASVAKMNDAMVHDYFLNGNHVGPHEFSTYFLISHLKEYVAPTEEDMLRLFQQELHALEAMKYNNNGTA